MKRTYQAVVAVAIVATVVFAAAAYYWDRGDGQIHGEYEFGYSAYTSYGGDLVSGDGVAIVDMSTITDLSEICTVWASDAIYSRPAGSMLVLEYYIDLYSEPGVTVDIGDISFLDLYDPGQNLHYSAFMMYGDTVVHHELCDMTATTDGSGHARISMILVVGEFWDNIPIIESDVNWSLRQ